MSVPPLLSHARPNANPPLEEQLKQKMARMFDKTITREEKGSLIEEMIRDNRKEAVFSLISGRALESKDLDECLKQNRSLQENYVDLLVLAARQNRPVVVRFLTALKAFKKALEDFPDRFAPALKSLVQLKLISPAEVDLLAKHPDASQAFIQILDEIMMSHDHRHVKKGCFAGSKILRDYITTKIREPNLGAIKGFIAKQLIEPEQLKQECKQSKALKQGLETELISACDQVSKHKPFLLFLIASGVCFRSPEIDKIAKSGDAAMLQALEKNGVDISDSVFRLIERGQGHIFRMLFWGNREEHLNPNLKNQEGRPLLLEAIRQNRGEIVGVLLDKGANPLILGPNGENVFDLAKGKDPNISRRLYRLRERDVGRGFGWTDQESVEEKALRQLLDRKAKSRPFSRFYCLLMKTHQAVIALLKADMFSMETPKSENDCKLHYPNHRIHCWSSTKRFPIPQELAPRHTTMQTLAFAITKVNRASDESVKIEGRHYACIQLENTYKTANPQEEYGFKYSYGSLTTHGHGKNPEAARSAFKGYLDGLRFREWKGLPDLRSTQESVSKHSEALNQLFEQGKQKSEALNKLAHAVDDFMDRGRSIIEARYTMTSSEEQEAEQDALIRKEFSSVMEKLGNADRYTWTQKRFEVWQEAIRSQIEVLQGLEQTLLKAAPMDSAHFKAEQEATATHLKGVKELITDRAVTSSELPTLKIYTSSLLIEDVFNPSLKEMERIKTTMFQLIGSSLHTLPKQIDSTAVTCFLKEDFRREILEQFHKEAQFMICSSPLMEQEPMQALATHFALLRDTSKILSMIPPVSIFSPGGHGDIILDGTMTKFANAYDSAMEILDRFWLKVCYEEVVLQNHLDEGLKLLTRRLWLMDEQVRVREKGHFVYPHMESNDPKKVLDEQLFALQTTLLTALSRRPGSAAMPFIRETVDLVKLRLEPAFYGTAKKPLKLYQLFLVEAVGILQKIKGVVDPVWEADPSSSSPFQPLKDRFAELPNKRAVEDALQTTFKGLSSHQPLPTFSPMIEDVVTKIREVRDEIADLTKNLGDKEQGFDMQAFTQHTKKVSKIMSYLPFEEVARSVPISEIFQSLDSPGQRERVKQALVARLGNEMNSSVIELERAIKKLPDLSRIEAGKAKTLQRVCGQCAKSMREYLEAQPPIEDVSTAFREFRTKALESLKSVERSVPILSQLIQKFEDNEGYSDEVMVEIRNLVGQLQTFLKGKKGKKLAPQLKGPITALSQAIDPFLPAILHRALETLLGRIQACQNGLHGAHIDKLKQVSAELSLGIREQVYHAVDHENFSYYLWDGKPFDATPYHTDNRVHIPLVDDRNRSSLQREKAMLERLNPYESENGYIEATRVRHANQGREAQRFSFDEEKKE